MQRITWAHDMLKAKNKWVKGKGTGMSIVVMRKLPQWHTSHTNKCFIKELRGETAQVITTEQKTLMIWLAIDCVCVCVCYCFWVFGSHPRIKDREAERKAWKCVLYCWRFAPLCLHRTLKKRERLWRPSWLWLVHKTVLTSFYAGNSCIDFTIKSTS